MAHLTDEAICIRHWDFSETSQTVSLFCRSHGILRGLAKGAKRAGGRFSGGIDLMTRGQVVAIVKPGRDLSTLTDWTLLATYRGLRIRLEANQAAYYMIDLVQRMLADADPHPRLFDGVIASFEALDAGDDAAPLLLAQQWLMLDECGYRPSLTLPATGGQTVQFSPEAGGVTASGGWKVRRATVELLQEIAATVDGWTDAIDGATDADNTARSTLRQVRQTASNAGPDVVGRANRLLAAYVRHVLAAFPETMRTLFPE